MHWLEDAGLITYWTNEVIANRISETKATSEAKSSSENQNLISTGRREVVLGLNHLQGAFYVLFLGSAVALFTLLVEKTFGHFT
ncbi:hypothetical protein Pmani_004235 [Petrolisthes manimaculis]|uniref:Uncharacterized protein n=1 Tax=Petrolisthes manimaculis TaxID=1843537 RepID=A0AAE1QEI0_9EUCA|nr:hypothetical protein Pmani_004235 [Petrolisthes manimaculis]